MSDEQEAGRRESREWFEDFEREVVAGFMRLGKRLDEAARSFRERTQPAPATPGIELLRSLRQMQNEGLITEEEFDAKKKEILARM